MPAELLSTRGPPPPPTHHQLTERRCYLIYLSRLLLRVSSSLVYWKEGGKEKGDVFIQHKLLTTRGVYRAHRLQLQQLGIRDEGHFVSLRHRKWIFRVWPVFRCFAGRTLYTYTRKKEKKHKASETGGLKGRRKPVAESLSCFAAATFWRLYQRFFSAGGPIRPIFTMTTAAAMPLSPPFLHFFFFFWEIEWEWKKKAEFIETARWRFNWWALLIIMASRSLTRSSPYTPTKWQNSVWRHRRVND